MLPLAGKAQRREQRRCNAIPVPAERHSRWHGDTSSKFGGSGRLMQEHHLGARFVKYSTAQYGTHAQALQERAALAMLPTPHQQPLHLPSPHASCPHLLNSRTFFPGHMHVLHSHAVAHAYSRQPCSGTADPSDATCRKVHRGRHASTKLHASPSARLLWYPQPTCAPMCAGSVCCRGYEAVQMCVVPDCPAHASACTAEAPGLRQ
jgi:hypothetical protein